MKRHLLTLTVIVCLSVAHGQITFTYSSFSPQNGDTYVVGKASPPSPGPSGANQTWDFSNVTITGSSTYTVTPASSVPCSSSYPFATQAIGTGGTYSMIKVSSSDYQFYGMTITPSVPGVVNSNPRQVFAFPMSYTNSFSDSYAGIDQNNVSEYGTTTVTYDGYGTVITPYGNYPNACRINVYVTVTDSTTTVNCTGTRDYYMWYVSAYRYPVAAIWSSTGNCSLTFGSEFLQGVSSGIEENIENASFNIFPNPFSCQTTLWTAKQLSNATLTIDNCFGQTVAQIKNISGQTVTFSRDNLASGLYFIRLIQDNKVLAVDKLLITDK